MYYLDQEDDVGLQDRDSGLDLNVALSRVDGDEEILREIAQIFVDSYLDQLAEVRKAIEANDAVALHGAAHSLKGSVGNFGAEAAFQIVRRLEMMGRNADLTGAAQALAELEAALDRLYQALVGLASGQI